MFIADTLLVLDQGAEVLTRGISRAYPDISYFLDEETEETVQPKQIDTATVVIESRTREINKKK